MLGKLINISPYSHNFAVKIKIIPLCLQICMIFPIITYQTFTKIVKIEQYISTCAGKCGVFWIFKFMQRQRILYQERKEVIGLVNSWWRNKLSEVCCSGQAIHVG